LGKKLPSHANFVLQKRIAHHVNGKNSSMEHKDSSARPEQDSRHATPEGSRHQPMPSVPIESGPQECLGPWEASITGVKPYEEVSRQVADFLFIHVVNNEDIGEIVSRGIQFEIEAKLGRLIYKDTNQRVSKSLASESILLDTGRTAFKSTMTEVSYRSSELHLAS
jgi:hypothetical protein